MSKIVVVGGTGYAGGWIARRAVARGHGVTSFSRKPPEVGATVNGVRYEYGSMLDEEARRRVSAGADAVVSALFPGGDLAVRLPEVNVALATLASGAGSRFGVVGGFSSLRRVEGGPRMIETEPLPAAFAEVARQMVIVLDQLVATPQDVDWFYATPAYQFGRHAPGEHRGTYRIGGAVALFDQQGGSAISGADFADAIIDELDRPRHHRSQFSVAS